MSTVLLSCLFCVKSSINHHQYSTEEMFTTAEDYEFSGKCLSKILCLTLQFLSDMHILYHISML